MSGARLDEADRAVLGRLPENPKADCEMVVAGMRVLSSRELFAPLPEPVYVIDQVVREASIVEIVAYGGSSKTWMGVDAAISVALGEKWLDRFETTQGPTLIVDYENGNYELRRRLQATGRGRGHEGPISGVSAMVMQPLYMLSNNFVDVMVQVCRGHRLAVIDTLRAANPGVDENDSNMRTGLDRLRRVAESTKCAFMVLAHAKKSGNQTDSDPREAGRGSSAIFDAADSVLHVRYREGEPQVVRQTKARQGRHVEPFLVGVRDTNNGGVIVRAFDYYEGGAVLGTESQALHLVRSQPGTYTQTSLANAMTGERAEAKRKRVRGLVEDGRLVVRDQRLYLADDDGGLNA